MSRLDDLERASTWLMEHGDDPGPLADLFAEMRAEVLEAAAKECEALAKRATDARSASSNQLAVREGERCAATELAAVFRRMKVAT